MKILPLFLPHQGCSHQCVYCNQALTVGTSCDEPRWHDRLLSLKNRQQDNTWEIAFYSGTFSALPKAVMDGCFQQVQPYKSLPHVSGIRISTRPDAVGDAVLDYLEENGVKTIELGVESLDDDVLRKSGRGHNAESVRDSCERIQQKGFLLGIHLMCGLPGQDEPSWKHTVTETIGLKPDMVRIAPTIVLRDTPLEKLFKRGKYLPLSLEEAVSQSAWAYREFIKAGISVARVGLALSDESGDGTNKIVAGPWHPALRHEVESYLALDILSDVIKVNKDVLIRIHPKDYSVVAGEKKKNLARWGELNFAPDGILRDETVSRHHYRLDDQAEKPLFYRHD